MPDISNWTDEGLRTAFLDALWEKYGQEVLSTKQITEFCNQNNYARPDWLLDTKQYKAGWGKYKIKSAAAAAPLKATPTEIDSHIANVLAVSFQETEVETLGEYIPVNDPTYKPFGFYNDLLTLVAGGVFYPVYITGLSGNGKTLMVLQAHNQAERELIRVNITKTTDELDLIGGYELINGNTVVRKGPAIVAMERGATLLLDETDYGTETLLCMQPILEGKPILFKKTGEVIYPRKGFNVIATANTKGRGSDDGRFVGANILNEAFLERFAITVEQEYPPEDVERSILRENFKLLNMQEEQFGAYLVKWASALRIVSKEGGSSEVISTRRLVHIVKAFAMFKNRQKAIELCLNRFDDTSKRAMLDAYTKIDPNPSAAPGFIYSPPPAPPPPPPPEPKKSFANAVPPNNQAPKGMPASPVPNSVAIPGKTATAQPWATPRHQMEVSRKFKTPMKIEPPDANGWIQVKSHNQVTPVNPLKINAVDGVLEVIIQINADKADGKTTTNPYI
jgi:AAA domain (dynein-related subfamily)